MQSTHPFIVKPGTTREIPGLKNIRVEIVEGYHRVQSLGYGFNTVTQKLKQEFKHLPGKEIGNLRKQGIEITEEQLVPELIFYGDTSARTLWENSEWKKYPVVVIECTMFQSAEKLSQERLKEHTAWFQVKDIVKDNQSNYFVFIHSSMSVNDDFLREHEKEQKEELNVENFCFFRDRE